MRISTRAWTCVAKKTMLCVGVFFELFIYPKLLRSSIFSWFLPKNSLEIFKNS